MGAQFMLETALETGPSAVHSELFDTKEASIEEGHKWAKGDNEYTPADGRGFRISDAETKVPVEVHTFGRIEKNGIQAGGGPEAFGYQR